MMRIDYYRKPEFIDGDIDVTWVMNDEWRSEFFFLPACQPRLNMISFSWMSQSTRTGCIVIDLLYNLYNLEDISCEGGIWHCMRQKYFKALQGFGFRSTLLWQMFQEANAFTIDEGERFEARNEPVDGFHLQPIPWIIIIDDPHWYTVYICIL